MMDKADLRYRGLLCSVITLCFLHQASQAAPVQPPGNTAGTASHRRLELPDGGTGDIQRQMQMLKQLQSMFSNQKDGQELKTPPVTPQQMEMIRQMIKNFSGQPPEDLMKQFGDLPPEMLSGVANDPNARQQIKDMLQQYAQDRQIPRGRSRSGRAILPPRGNEKSQSSNQTNSGTEAPNPPKDDNETSIDDLLNKLKEFEKKHLSQQADSKPSSNPKPKPTQRTAPPSTQTDRQRRTDNSSSPEPPRTGDWDPSRRPRKPSAPKSSGQLSDEEINRRIDELLRQQNGEKPANSESENPAGSGRSSQQASNGTHQTDQLGGQEKIPGAPDVASVSEFMKKFDTLFPERTGAKKTSSTSTPGSPANAEAAKQEAAAEVRRTQQKVKAELSQKGFRETLKRIARDAQREAKKARPANAGETNGGTAADSSGFSDAMTKAMKGITKDLVSIVKDGKFKTPKASQNGGRSGRSRSGQSGSSTMSTLGGIANSASDFISDVASAPQVSSPPPAAMAPTSSSGEFETGMLLPIAVLIALIAGGIALAWKFEVIGPDSTRFGKNSSAAMAKGIQTRADIVRAFHQMALKPAVGSEAWWTHQKVVDEMVEETPDKATPATTLSTLYEQARYLPEDVEFTSLQIENAKQALTQCQR